MTPELKLLRIAELQHALAQFPSAPSLSARCWESGWAALDRDGGIGYAMVTEVCGTPTAGPLFLHEMLGAIRRRKEFAALVDCGRTFDPGSHGGGALERLLYVGCGTAEQGVKVADLLLRDGNLPVVLLDLQALPLRSLGRIPTNTWHRFQRLVEKSGTVFIALTPQPVVEAARVRITLRGEWHLHALRRRRQELVAELGVQVFHRGRSSLPILEPLVQTA